MSQVWVLEGVTPTPQRQRAQPMQAATGPYLSPQPGTSLEEKPGLPGRQTQHLPVLMGDKCEQLF